MASHDLKKPDFKNHDLKKVNLTSEGLSLEQLRLIYQHNVEFHIDDSLKETVKKSSELVIEALNSNDIIYGVNTGFGILAHTHISFNKLTELQQNLIHSHKAGVGAYLDEKICRLVLSIKINTLAAGYSGVRWELIERLLTLFNQGIYPCLHSKGSVGASGDLAPLADLAGVLIGIGDAWVKGEITPAEKVLKKLGWEPFVLGPKEGLSLINGTQVSTGLALAALFKTERLLGATIVSGSAAVEASKGSHSPFHPDIQRLRNQRGQQHVANWYRTLLEDSEKREVLKVQDPYCLRCQPVVMGACLDQMQYAADILYREANAVTDNPLVIHETGEIVSGGNFHAEPVAFAADGLALAIAEIASMAERRIALLMDAHFSGLPAFLVPNSGLHSGLMIAHVTAASLVSENKSLAHPASVDSIPTSANQEDHVSMATYAARRLHEMLENSAYVTAIELLTTIRALTLQAGLKISERLDKHLYQLESLVQLDSHDHVLTPEIEALQKAVLSGKVASVLLESNEEPCFID
jgi:histidine ammonia-lyase